MTQKPDKPTPDFPLFPHATGRWAKKIKGKLQYFGPWSDPAAALERYLIFCGGPEPDKVASATTTDKSAKPALKPSPDFPLTAASNGQWCKKIRGRRHYFGVLDNPQAALDKYLEVKDALRAGRRPRVSATGLTVGGLVDHFLTNTKNKVGTKELRPRTLSDYKIVMAVVIRVFGRDRLVEDLGPDDFEKLRNKFAKTHGPVALSGDVTRVRRLFNYGHEQFQVQPHYGASFKKPTKSVLRKERKRRPKKFFQAEHIRAMLDVASPPMKAMILLGINCAFGNTDCAMLELRNLDLDNRRHTHPRPKTGIDRPCPLWPETVAALRDYLAIRPTPRSSENMGRVFITSRGSTWEQNKDDNPMSKEFAKLTKSLGIHEAGVGFYALRHTFQTIGDSSGQMVAVKFVMGHAPSNDDMAAIYREHTFEENIQVIQNFVRNWLNQKTSQPQVPTPPDTSVSAEQPATRLRLFVAETPEAPLLISENEVDHRAG